MLASVAVPGLIGAAALQQGPPPPSDSVLVESPLPGGIAAFVRFLLNTVPSSVQIGGAVIGAIAGIVVVWYLVRRRREIRAWLGSRTRGVALALAAGALVVATAAVGMGAATWNYTQHSNDFCTGCHVMGPAFQRFTSASNKHAELSCHDCHTQSIFASARQLYVWIAERPQNIGEHARVPNRVCETCHVTGDSARWQRIASTAGHRVHLESDSADLKGLQCVSCHGAEVHRFKPVSGTCGQSGCHEQSETNIVLGKMAGQTARHCTSCHAFKAEVPLLATRDSARGTLVAGQEQCLGCHEMRQVLGDFDAAKEPHAGKCGTCHNPHTQRTPGAAVQTCTTSGCHSNWRDEPFHVGANHRSVGARCLTCHVPHQAKVDASYCTGCHANVRSRSNLRPPMPFDTTRALRRTSAAPTRGAGGVRILARVSSSHIGEERSDSAPNAEGFAGPVSVHDSWSADDVGEADVAGDDGGSPGSREPPRGPGWDAPADGGAQQAQRPPPAPADTFTHTRHARLACLVCHQTSGGGRLTFEPPRGCTICHHPAPASARCASCHQPQELAVPIAVAMTVAVPRHPPNTRQVDFPHDRHGGQTCVSCHTTPVTLAPPPAIAQCKDCHTDHHAADRACASCHKLQAPKAQHATLDVAHQRCASCHTASTIAQLTPTRTFCSTCHTAKATNHYDRKECTTCHFLSEPATYRAKLTAARQ